jgi:hypothetical protein
MSRPLRFAASVLIAVSALSFAAEHKTKRVIFVMTDGLRRQEMFAGADAALMNKQNGAVKNPDALKKAYWRETPEERRETLLPFVWGTMGKKGQIFGNREIGSDAYVTNGRNFSDPGYSETLCGFPDERINSNDKIPNANVTVFEWLHKKAAFRGKVAAFGAWDVFPFIFNAQRAGFPVNAGHDPFLVGKLTPRLEFLNQVKAESPRLWDAEPFDVLTFHTALEYMKRDKPRVLYISLGETDEWAHEGRYAEYLGAAARVDAYLKQIWDTAQSMSEYRGQTTLIFAPDHGRGEAPVEWKSHGEKIPDSKYIWMAFLGPDTKPLGMRSNVSPVTQSQIAATLAAFLGEDYVADVPKAGKPIAEVLP